MSLRAERCRANHIQLTQPAIKKSHRRNFARVPPPNDLGRYSPVAAGPWPKGHGSMKEAASRKDVTVIWIDLTVLNR